MQFHTATLIFASILFGPVQALVRKPTVLSLTELETNITEV